MDVLKRKVADQKAQEEKEVEKRKRQQRMQGRVRDLVNFFLNACTCLHEVMRIF